MKRKEFENLLSLEDKVVLSIVNGVIGKSTFYSIDYIFRIIKQSYNRSFVEEFSKDDLKNILKKLIIQHYIRDQNFIKNVLPDFDIVPSLVQQTSLGRSSPPPSYGVNPALLQQTPQRTVVPTAPVSFPTSTYTRVGSAVAEQLPVQTSKRRRTSYMLVEEEWNNQQRLPDRTPQDYRPPSSSYAPPQSPCRAVSQDYALPSSNYTASTLQHNHLSMLFQNLRQIEQETTGQVRQAESQDDTAKIQGYTNEIIRLLKSIHAQLANERNRRKRKLQRKEDIGECEYVLRSFCLRLKDLNEVINSNRPASRYTQPQPGLK